MHSYPVVASPRARLLFLGSGVALLAVYCVLWLLLPSRFVHVDAFDELAMIEGPVCWSMAKHPLTEPTLWTMFRGLRALGYEGSAIRPVQLWNGALLTVCLVALAVLGRRRGASPATALGIPLLLGSTYAALHLALDPYLSYWPPALALATLALLAATIPGRRGGATSCVLACAAVLYNPMAVFLLPGVAAAYLLPPGTKVRAIGLQRLGRTALLVGVPALVLLLAFAPEGRMAEARVGPWGRFYAETPEHTWAGFTRLFQPESIMVPAFEAGLAPLRGLAWIVLGAAGAAIGLRLTILVVSSLAGVFWLLGIAASTAFAAWWDPSQHQFWLLPLWVAFAALLERGAFGAGPMVGSRARWFRSLVHSLPLLAGAVLLVANLFVYVLPSARGEDPQRARAEEVAQAFPPTDLLVFPLYQELHVDYWAKRETTGFLALRAHKQPDETTFDHLRRRKSERAPLGGRTWVLVEPDGSPSVHSELFHSGYADFTPDDLRRLRLGEARAVRGWRFRELVAVEPQDGGAADAQAGMVSQPPR